MSKARLLKATYNDHRSYLSTAITEKFEKEHNFTYVTDFDESYVYFEINEYYDGGRAEKTLKLSYTIDGVNVTLGEEDPTEVVRESLYTDVKVDEKSITKTIIEAIASGFKSVTALGDSNTSISLKAFNKDSSGAYRIDKFNEEAQLSFDPLYAPPDSGDSDAEAMSEDTIVKMVASLNKGIKNGTVKPNLFHKKETKAFEFVEAFVNPWPTCYIDGTEVAKGQPVLVTHYINKAAWELRKAGKIKGPSIGAIAGKLVEVEDE